MSKDPVYSGAIIDAHCHVASTYFIPREFVDGTARNIAVKLAANGAKKSVVDLTESICKQHQDHDADGLVREMDDAGISQAVLLLPDFTFVMKCGLTIAEMMERHRAISERHPGRFYIFAGVDPRWGNDGLDLFERAICDTHFHGLKLYPPCGYSPSDRMLYPFFDICKRHRIPALVHIGPSSPALSFAYSNPWLIDQAARDFPDVNFILAHAAVHFVEDCLALAEYRPNIFLDISAFAGISPAPNGWKAALSNLFRKGINHKILFGTDWPLFGGPGRHARLMQAFVGQDGPLSGISSAQREWIMSGNILRLIPTN